jgi:DNA-binding PadR family transcriptional regulator
MNRAAVARLLQPATGLPETMPRRPAPRARVRKRLAEDDVRDARTPRLGTFELVVLLALMQLKDEAYGLPIVGEIESRVGRGVAPGSVYAALSRLEEKGFVSSRLGAPTAERGGKAKRYFRVTPAGAQEVDDVRRTLVRLWHGLPPALDESA